MGRPRRTDRLAPTHRHLSPSTCRAGRRSLGWVAPDNWTARGASAAALSGAAL